MSNNRRDDSQQQKSTFRGGGRLCKKRPTRAWGKCVEFFSNGCRLGPPSDTVKFDLLREWLGGSKPAPKWILFIFDLFCVFRGDPDGKIFFMAGM